MPPPTNTRVKIRYGLILQGVLARALTAQGYAYDETPAYDEDSEVPDFLIPNAEVPEFAVEVHQTDARDHFRMKTLRSLTAVAEAKAFFGPGLISMNVLFGDPDTEVPEANLRAMCGIFDVNVLLQRDAGEAGLTAIRSLEVAALELAQDTDVSTADAADQLIVSQESGVTAIGELMTNALAGGVVNESLTPMWEADQERRGALGNPPAPGNSTFYKKNMIRALYFQDSDFDAMVDETDPDAWAESLQQQVVRTKTGEMVEDIDGDHLVIDPEFARFLRDGDTPRLRALCKNALDESDAMHWFFEDIRDEQRRLIMGEHIISLLNEGRARVEEEVYRSIVDGDSGVVPHARAWIADILPLLLNRSHNYFNGLMYRDNRYPLSIANPYPNIVIRSPRVLSDRDHAVALSDLLCALIWEQAEADGEDFSALSPEGISSLLFKFRIDAAIKLKKVDPLVLVIQALADEMDLMMEEVRLSSLYSGFSDDRQIGVFRFFRIYDESGAEVFCNVLAAYENPTDKAKEWAARRLAIGYEFDAEKAKAKPNISSLFIIDGVWAQKDINRLFRAGWDMVVRLQDLESTLRDIFQND